MYSSAYGYGTAAGQPYNGAPQGQSPQMQPGPGQNQPQQQMMYNQQQYPMGASGGAYSGAPNPGAMMPGTAGPAGMMQNTAMPQMAANSQMGYQAPFTSSPYGPNVPSTAAASPGQYGPNYMMASAGGGYSMAPGAMNAQQQQQQHQQHNQMMMQRMQQASQNQPGMGTPTQQRQFSGSQGTPNPGQQNHFGTPQNPPAGTPQPHQTPTPAPHSANSVTTPQTPTFPLMGQGPTANGNSAPASPGTQLKDQERFVLLLDINTELLYEAMFLKNGMTEIKKEILSNSSADQQEELRKEEVSFSHDLNQVNRRLQANLQYMVTLTANKPDSVRQPAPMYLSCPPLNMDIKLRPLPPSADSERLDGAADRVEREKMIKDMYARLHVLFPGIDHTKEPVFTPVAKPSGPNSGVETLNSQRMASIGAQMQGSSAPSPVSSVHQTTPQMATMPGPASTSSA